MDNSIPAFPRRNHARSQTLDAYTGTLLSERAPTQDYSSTRGVEVRFTKIPLIATLMAVALSLLIVLPALAVSGERTNGRLASGDWVDVRVADDVNDIAGGTTIGATGAHATGNNAFDARDTFFDGTLYISNQKSAYNTILITAKAPDSARVDSSGNDLPSGVLDDLRSSSTEDESLSNCGGVNAVVATVKNERSGVSAKAYLLQTTDTEENDQNIYHGVAAVWDQEDAIEKHDGPCNPHEDPSKFEVGSAIDMVYDNDAANSKDPEDGWNPLSAAVIPARDGDTILVTVNGVTGRVVLTVDGEAPSIDDVSPGNGGTQNKKTVALAFSVKDDGAGIRFDGESGASGDADPAPHNGDNDNNTDEPISLKTPGNDGILGNADDGFGNGSTWDIDVNFTGEVDADYNPCKVDVSTCEGNTGANDPNRRYPDKPYKAALDADSVHLRSKASAEWGTTTESSLYGSQTWTEVGSPGVEYIADVQIGGNGFGTYYWQVSAMDRVGNKAVTDADEDNAGDQPYSFKVDDAKPKVDVARTGVGYEAGEGEFADRSWIALNFINDGGNDGPDVIDASTVAASDFTVGGSTVVNAIVPSDKKTCKGNDPDTDDKDESADNITAFDAKDGKAVVSKTDSTNIGPVPKDCDFEPRARVYLQLADDLDSDAEPTVQLLGGVLKDIAGNSNVTQSINKAADRIAPGVSITVTSSSGTTGRAATDEDGTFTVRVESDEALVSFPVLYSATLQGSGPASAATGINIRNRETHNLSEKETNTWEAKVKVEDLAHDGKSNDDRILALIVTAEDENNNTGNSAGWSGGAMPAAGDKLDFKKLDAGNFLVEVDSSFKPATIDVLPATNPEAKTKDKTESMNPYIQIEFPDEANEYGIDLGTTASDPAYKAAIKDGKPSSTDSHADVTITSFTINGEDKKAEIVRVKAGEYVLALTGLEVGEYEIVYTAHDDVGNDIEADDSGASFTFEVQKRQPYKVELQPGWNLVSVPGDPFNPAVGEVVGASLKADTVLSYQGGEWVTAVRNDEGRWQGTLTDIQGGYGYWVRTTALESISTVIPPILPTDNLPSVPVVSGWNLLGVVDARQRKAGTTEDADQYFTSLDVWRVAYSFNTRLNSWTKLLPGTDDNNVENGKGYWVWSTNPGTLVP